MRHRGVEISVDQEAPWGRRVDPDRRWQELRLRLLAFASCGVSREGRRKGLGAGRDDVLGAAVVDIGGGREGDPRLAVVVVVTVEEPLAVCTGVL
jgi:hypothetical protein